MIPTRPSTITIEPVGGICNRLQAIHSAAHLAAITGKSLDLVWVVNTELGASFQQLFEPLPAVRNITTLVRHEPTRLQRLKYHLHQATSNWASGRYFGPLDIKDVVDKKIDLSKSNLSEHCYIKTWNLFSGSEVPFLRFEPIVDLKLRISQIKANFDNTIGVHIRRTDNREAIQSSPTSAIIEVLNREVDRDPETTFFLATDDPRERVALQDSFGDRIVSADTRRFERSSVNAIKDAVVELFCLAACDRIIGSAGSTFSQIAARIGGASLSIVRY